MASGVAGSSEVTQQTTLECVSVLIYNILAALNLISWPDRFEVVGWVTTYVDFVVGNTVVPSIFLLAHNMEKIPDKCTFCRGFVSDLKVSDCLWHKSKAMDCLQYSYEIENFALIILLSATA